MQALKASKLLLFTVCLQPKSQKGYFLTKFIIVCALTILEGSKFMNLIEKYHVGVRGIVHFLLAVWSQTSRTSQNLLSIVTMEFQGCLQESYGICWDFTEYNGICWNFMKWFESHGNAWSLTECHGGPRHLAESYGISRNLQESQNRMESNGIWWTIKESHGISKNLMEFHGKLVESLRVFRTLT